MNLIRRTVDRALADEKRDQALERKAKESDARRTEQPDDRPR